MKFEANEMKTKKKHVESNIHTSRNRLAIEPSSFTRKYETLNNKRNENIDQVLHMQCVYVKHNITRHAFFGDNRTLLPHGILCQLQSQIERG